MSRPQQQHQQQQLPLAMRALLQLLLFSNIVQQHWTTALPSTATPSLFHVAAAAAATAASSSSSSSVPSATELTPAVAATSAGSSIMDLAKSVAVAQNDDEHGSGSGWDNLETEMALNFNLATQSSPPATNTAPTSIEQQDQPPPVPAIPATTLAFANAVAGDTMDSSHGDATPPYAAVDDSYGK